VADGKISKHEAICRPLLAEKKSMRMLFSIRADGNLCAQSKPEAIFRPPLTKK